MEWFISIVVVFLSCIWVSALIMSSMIVGTHDFFKRNSSIVCALLLLTYPAFFFILMYGFELKFFGTSPLYWATAILALGALPIFAFGLPCAFLRNLRREPTLKSD